MVISKKLWLILFFIILIIAIAPIPIYNYLTDYNVIFDNKYSKSYRLINQGVQYLSKGYSIHRGSYNRNQIFLVTDLYSATINPDILILGTSRTMTISQKHFPEQNEQIFNASINGGNFEGIVAIWESFKKHTPQIIL
ncbi:hypothetical protein PVA44_04335 [Entomospira nematocerorum]|uniref:Uncharacterized protein n=1 Tax=Entomospira nematocerorum TaxID=2719987 RepID=A0A968GBD9_9SPIO|nr:hypothetical protein [Entomospira nematocera]NIZ46747.1 hypothetical protein [Entomospira nematocera]WDI33457.1 hypothetical protein PVA44_04335 [Entomospira nematocera]